MRQRHNPDYDYGYLGRWILWQLMVNEENLYQHGHYVSVM